jgi:hypothetical protein
MALSTYDISAEQGSDYLATITYKNSSGVLVNLTGYTARMQVRRTLSSDDAYLRLTSAGGLALGGAAGTIGITISAAAMETVPSGSYVYDLEIIDTNGKVTKILKGDFEVAGEATR